MAQLKAKILCIHGISAIGGAERKLLVILERLSTPDFQLVVVCPEGGVLLHEVGQRGIPTRSVPFASGENGFPHPVGFGRFVACGA